MIHYFTTSGIGNAWVANELSVVNDSDIPFELHAMRKPETTYHRAIWAERLNEQTKEIYPLPLLGIIISIISAPVLFKWNFFSGLLNAVFGKRENFKARISCFAHFFVACHWARIHRYKAISHIHSQWAHSCCSIAMYAAWLLNKSFSFTGHGTDLWRDRVALEDKIRRADFIACISNFHRDLYLKHGARPEQLHIVYCGIDVERFSPSSEDRLPNDGIIHIRSSGRLVEKKGFTYLIEACNILKNRGINFECIITGSGPLEQELRNKINLWGLFDKVTLTGDALKQEDIPSFFQSGTLYCLPCVWASDNDADGLPQMLMEAMASGLPSVSTHLVGIPDLVINNKTGLLVAPNEPEMLADAIYRLSADKPLAERLSIEGRNHICTHFDLNKSLRPLIDFYHQKLTSIKLS